MPTDSFCRPNRGLSDCRCRAIASAAIEGHNTNWSPCISDHVEWHTTAPRRKFVNGSVTGKIPRTSVESRTAGPGQIVLCPTARRPTGLQANQGDEPETISSRRQPGQNVPNPPPGPSSHWLPASSHLSAPGRALARAQARDSGQLDQRAQKTPDALAAFLAREASDDSQTPPTPAETAQPSSLSKRAAACCHRASNSSLAGSSSKANSCATAIRRSRTASRSADA